MTMLWKQTPKNLAVETELGTIYVNITSGDSIHVSAPSSHARLKFRGKEYHFSCHLELRDGTWQKGRDWDHFRRTGQIRDSYTAAYISKVDSYKINDPVAPTFQTKMFEVVLAAVQAFMKDKQELVHEAAVADVNNDVDRCDDEIRELKAKIDTVKMKRREVLSKLSARDASLLLAERLGYEMGMLDGKAGKGVTDARVTGGPANLEGMKWYQDGYDAGYEATRPLTSDEQAEVDEVLRKAGER